MIAGPVLAAQRTPAKFLNPYGSGSVGACGSGCHGSMTPTPVSRKSLELLRVANPAPCVRQMEAICASNPSIGRPARSRSLTTVAYATAARSEEHTSELQSRRDLVCRLLLEKKK